MLLSGEGLGSAPLAYLSSKLRCSGTIYYITTVALLCAHTFLSYDQLSLLSNMRSCVAKA